MGTASIRSVRTALAAIRSDRRGAAALEFSVIALFMITLMLGAYDLGNAAQQQVQLQEAVRAGGQSAMTDPTNTNRIQNAVNGALNGWALRGGAPNVACYCLNPATGALSGQLGDCSAASLATCTAPNQGKVVKITAQMNFAPLSAVIPGFVASATYDARIQ